MKAKKQNENLNLFGVSYESLADKRKANNLIVSSSKQAFRHKTRSLNELSRLFLETAKDDRNTALLLLDALKIKVASFHAQNIAKELEKVDHKQVLQLFKANFQSSTENKAVRKITDIPKQMYHFENVELFTDADIYKAIDNARNNKTLTKVETGVYFNEKGEKLSETKAEQLKKDFTAKELEKAKQLELIESKKNALYDEYLAQLGKDSKDMTKAE